MILIRGIKSEEHARKIDKGIVDCRDILSAILHPPKTGYDFSDYYEKNLVKALSFFSNKENPSLSNPDFLYSLLIDYYIPHIYLTYFHVLNERSIEWLDNFEDDYNFIAINVKIDRNTKAVIGNGFFGAKMRYVDSIREIPQGGSSPFYAACLCSIENQFPNKRDVLLPVQIYNTLAFPLLCRELDKKFTDIENEFRIIAYDCPKKHNGAMMQLPRSATLSGKSGTKYEGLLNAGRNTIFKSNIRVLRSPEMFLSEVLEREKGLITIDSKFKSLNINDISDDYRFLGGKKECEAYIRRMIKHIPEDVYVDKTIIKKHKIADLHNPRYAPSYAEVIY